MVAFQLTSKEQYEIPINIYGWISTTVGQFIAAKTLLKWGKV